MLGVSAECDKPSHPPCSIACANGGKCTAPQPSGPPPPAPAPVPADWAARIADGRMLFNPSCTVSNHVSSVWGDHAPVANGYLGTYVDSGTVYIAGTFTGLADLAGTNAPGSNASNGRLQRSHLARVPHRLTVRVGNSSAAGCALDLERGVYYRRSTLHGAAIEQRWFAHRTNKALLIMELDVVAASPTTLSLSLEQENSSTVKLPPSYIMSPPEDDVDWDLSPAGCPDTLTCRLGNTTSTHQTLYHIHIALILVYSPGDYYAAVALCRCFSC